MPALTDDDELTTTAASDEAPDQTDDLPEAPTADDSDGASAISDDGLDDDEIDLDDEATAEADALPDADGTPSGRARNPDGTFAKASDAPASTEAAPPADAPPPPSPWKANLYGTEAEPIPGALYRQGVGVLVPESQVGMLTALVARGSKYDEFKRERRDAAEAVSRAVAPVQFEAKTLADTLTSTALNPEWVTQAALDPDTAIRELRLALKDAALTHREQFGNVARPTTTERGEPEIDPYDLQAVVRDEVATLTRDPQYQGLLSPQDAQALESRIVALNPIAFDEHGQAYLDRHVAREVFALAAESRRQLIAERQAHTTSQKAQAAADRNRRVAGKTTPPPKRPAVSAPPAFDGDPWDNPALSFDERKAAWRKAHGG